MHLGMICRSAAAMASAASCRQAMLSAQQSALPGILAAKHARLHQCNLRMASGGGRGSGGNGKRPRATAQGPGDFSPKRPGNAWETYLELLDTHPLLTRAATCGLLTALGDTFCQLVVEAGKLDLKRVFTYSAVGFLLTGPVLYRLYLFIERVAPGTSLRSVFTAVAIDQLVFQPPWIALLMTILTTAEGKPETLWPKLQQDWVPAVKTSWLIWIPAQYFNFRFVPLTLRVTFDAVVALLWNVYLSFQTHKAVVKQ